MKTLFVCDIDGTIADSGPRFKSAGFEPDRDKSKEEHEAWLHKVQSESMVLKDVPVPGMLSLVNAIQHNNADFMQAIYLTGRTEDLRIATELWLYKNNFPMAIALHMRPLLCYDKAGIFKECVIRREVENKKYDAVVVMDDDYLGDVEEMCKRNKWTFLKARSGSGL